MSQSMYPSRVQKILRRLQKTYGSDAATLALQALEALARTQSSSDVRPPQAHTHHQPLQSLLERAYTVCCQQTKAEWVHQARLYAVVQTLQPGFSYKADFKTWPKFLLAQSMLFESQVMHEQLHVRLLPS